MYNIIYKFCKNSLHKEIKRYSKLNGYKATKYEKISCHNCNKNNFLLYSDGTENSAFLKCTSCTTLVDINDTKQYADNVSQNICICYHDTFKISIGYSFYDSTKDIRWLYVGGHCTKCSLDGVYVDWGER